MENPSGKKKARSESSAGDQKVDLSPTPVVQKLMDPSGSLPEVVTLVGYLGASDRNDSVRLYLDLDFKSYFEIPKEGAVVYRVPDDPADLASPSKILVRATAKITFVRVLEHAAEAAFLVGSIRSGSPVHGPVCYPPCRISPCVHDASTQSTHFIY